MQEFDTNYFDQGRMQEFDTNYFDQGRMQEFVLGAQHLYPLVKIEFSLVNSKYLKGQTGYVRVVILSMQCCGQIL